MKIIAEIVTAIILLVSGFFMAPDLISEFRIETFKKVSEGLSPLEDFTIKLTK